MNGLLYNSCLQPSKWNEFEQVRKCICVILMFFYNNLKSKRLNFKQVTINASAHVAKRYVIILQIVEYLFHEISQYYDSSLSNPSIFECDLPKFEFEIVCGSVYYVKKLKDGNLSSCMSV